MHIQFVEIRNFRKLKSIRIDFADKTTLFVGANNSGKTSAIAALGSFLVGQKNFSTHDITLSNWNRINEIGKTWETQGFTEEDWEALLPSLDLWLQVAPYEIHHVNHLLPTLDWEGGLLGIRLRLEPQDPVEFYKEYTVATTRADQTRKSAQRPNGGEPPAVALWPRNLREFLERRMVSVLGVRAYALDPREQKLPENGVARPQPLPMGSDPIEGDPLKGLIRIDMIHAQRDFADALASRDRLEGIDRRDSRKLSAQLQAYYDKHLNPLESPEPSDLGALEAIQTAERVFDEKLRIGFSAALEQVENLGYPGVTDPRLTISTKIRLTDGLDHKAAVQYDVLPGKPSEGTEPLRLPEDYNGLGYQNLISIVFRLMSFRDDWMRVGKAAKKVSEAETGSYSPPPLHLVLIEEPEAHLHAQVQQVFIREAYRLLRNHESLRENPRLRTQLAISTHSSHVAHECDFSWLRYFRRRPAAVGGEVPITTVVNLSEVFGTVSDTWRFVTRYLKATHCDLFFADGAILVEGPAERILVPQFVQKVFPPLNKSYVTVLEIGGSHAHRLRQLIEHLGLVTLIITDLDATSPSNESVPPSRGKGQSTRNATLKTWVPAKDTLDELFAIPEEEKVKAAADGFAVRVAYQCPLTVQLNGGAPPTEVIPNTFEDALAYENIGVFKGLNLGGDLKRFRGALEKSSSAENLAQKLFGILQNAKKAEMALDLLMLEGEPWPIEPPKYIRDGLSWLQDQVQNKQRDVLPPSNPAMTQAEATC